ncbi:GNAT family N-acetyltransferase [Mycobacteroides saopaulense]|uniref:GNAT family N-acetyltransferase n=1 Tax=Mycobacteroides saopaulense TaxID=1578165 RepID=A0A1S4VDX6_9MYCO|nr:GNAT family N-acetyltransferase [Mycobacteroides saopaulense]ALR12067.1 acetyltransferase [Mycobacteroides saopaulense]ORB60754.1 GNAT family N-acetyltransferase [Mycobacteroides saopaulense]
MEVRHARPSDHGAIKEAIPQWWSGSRTPDQARELAMLVPPLFLQHFASTSWIVEENDELAAFLVGFHSADHNDQAYIHFVGVDPRLRGQGIARRLYDVFFTQARTAGRTVVKAITSPNNDGSIAYHGALGFTVQPGDKEINGLPVHSDYDGPGEDRVCFVRRIV